jgi:RNA polymerase sigma-70 factor (ECF subfamily)
VACAAGAKEIHGSGRIPGKRGGDPPNLVAGRTFVAQYSTAYAVSSSTELSSGSRIDHRDMSTSGPSLVLVEGGETTAGAPALAGRSDDELMLLARGGVADAFDALIRRYQDRVVRMAARHLGRVGAAADVAQNAFLAVYRAVPRYQARGRFAAYLFRTVLNECRMARRWHRVRDGVAPWAAVSAAPVEDQIASTASSAEELVLERERDRDVAAALTCLSDKLRDVVSLRYGAGLGHEEIAETLQIPVGTAKRRLFDAMEKLRRQLRES